MKKKGLFVITLFVLVFAQLSQARGAVADAMGAVEVRKALIKQGATSKDIEVVLTALDQIEQYKGEPLVITSVLKANYMNAAAVLDSDNLIFSGTTFNKQKGEVVKSRQLVRAHWRNDGLNFELGYKWMFVFLADGLTVQELDGLTCGRGIGIALPILALAGVQVAWLPCQDGSNAYVIAPVAGVTGAITFPKLEFSAIR